MPIYVRNELFIAALLITMRSMKKIFLSLILGLSLTALAQDGVIEIENSSAVVNPPVSVLEKEKAFLSAAIEIPDVVPLGNEVVFDATPSKIISLSDFL